MGNSSNKTVNSIKTTKYINKLFEILDNDIHLLELLDSEFILPEQQVVNALLPKVYQNPNMPSFFQSCPDAVEWKKLKEAEKAKIPPYRPEDLTHTASDGTKMRSLSEVIIANYLLSLGITFVYELPLTHHGKRIFPDFTILSPIDNKTEIIIEHQGAMDSEQYQGKFIRTVLFYLETGLVPNKDVFFTFNHLNRNLDLRQIDSILHIAFGYGT